MEFLGELEETVLTMVIILDKQECYGNALVQEMKERLDRSLSLSAIHTTLYRLEEKGLLSSEMGGATDARGGRRKRFFRITNAGFKRLEQMRDQRLLLWKHIPQFNYSSGT